MKKALLMGTILAAAMLATGCMKKYEYTEQQTDALAEYAAVLLIDSDKDYKSNFTFLGTIGGESTVEVKDDKTYGKDNSQGSKDNNKQDNSENNAKDKEETTSRDNSSLNDVLGVKNFNIAYKGYKLHTSYPDEDKNAYFYLTPGDGEKLLVVTFKIKNVANKGNELELLGKHINYKLTSGNDDYKSLLTLLEDDLQHYSGNFKKGETKKAILVFEVPEKMDTSNMELIVTSGKKTEIVALK